MRQGSRHPAPFEARPPSVVDWRAERLLAAGFDARLAAGLARDCSFDIHAVLELVDRGCPPELTVRIAAPLEERARPC